MPGSLFAAMLMPVPDQQKNTPSSQSPEATARAASSATSTHGASLPVAIAPNVTTV
jgi:hypothetical protein